MTSRKTTTRSLGRGLLAALTASALLTTVHFGDGAAFAADRANTIIVGLGGQLNTLDPLRADYNQTNTITSALYDTLVTYDETTLVDSLATEYAYTDDAKAIELTLRSDVTFHDGTPLTAKDVAYTLDRLKKLGTGIASLVTDYESTTVTDDTHLTINLSKPNALFLPALSKVYILNSALVEQNKGSDDAQAWLQNHDAGSGAYTLASSGNGIELARFDDYWSPLDGRAEAIIFRRIDESSTRRSELIAGNIDVVFGLADRDAESLKDTANIEVVPINTSYQAEIIFNTQKGVTADPKVREALRMVYDYEGGLKGIRFNNGALADGPLPPRLSCRPEIEPVHRDIEAAKALLAEAGHPNLEVTLNFQPVFELQKQEATLFQSNALDAGVKVNLEPIAFPNYLASLQNPDSIPQMMLLEDFAQYPDPGVMLLKGYHSKSVGTNRAGYSNPEVDRLLDEAVATADDEKRCDLYRQIQSILDEDSVMIDMYTVYKPSAYRTDRLSELNASMLVTPAAPAQFTLAQ